MSISVNENFGFLVYKAIFGPSNLARVICDSGGIDFKTVLEMNSSSYCLLPLLFRSLSPEIRFF